MARMLGVAGRRSVHILGHRCHCPDCHDGIWPDKQTQRAREKRSVAAWADEYEDPADVVERACPKGGPDCGCRHYLPHEMERPN